MSDETFVDFFAMATPPAIREAFGASRRGHRFPPFWLRFRPFIAGRDSRKMPSGRAFVASTVRNAV